jgi:ABC-2 type transport system permease protein
MTRETLRTTALVARLYLLRGWRRALANPRTLALRAGFLVALWLYVVLVDVGQPPSEIETEKLRGMIRGSAAGAWILLAGIAAAGTPTAADSVQGSSFLLRSAGLRATLWGTVLGKYARRVALFGAFAVATAFALLWGFDVPGRNPAVFLVLLVFFLTAELAGRTARLAVAAAGVSPGGVGKVLLGGIGVTALSLGIGEFETTVSLLSRLPVAAFGDAFMGGVPGLEPNDTLLAAATVGGLFGAVVLAVAVEQLALRSWFRGGTRERAGTERTRVDDLLGRIGVTGPTRAITWRLWLQSRRRPLVLGLLAVPGLLVGLALVEPGGTDIPLFPLFVGLYTVWMATVTVGLNPLSSEDETLPHLLAAPGADVVRGYAATTILIGLPVVAVSVVLAGLLVGPLWLTVPALALSGVVLLGVVPTAIAIGLVLPRVGALQISVDGPIAPSKFAIGAHTLVLALLAAPAALALTFASSLPAVAVFAGIGVTALVSLLAGAVTLDLAARRLDGLTLE